MIKLIYTLTLLLLVTSLTKEQLQQKRIVTIEPSAFASMRYYFNGMVIFIQDGDKNIQELQKFVDAVPQIDILINDTSLIFGIINLQDDVTGALKQYNLQPSINVVTERNINSMEGYDVDKIPQFFKDIIRPPLKKISLNQVPSGKNVLMFGYPNSSSFTGFQNLYYILKQDLQQFDTQCVAIEQQNISISLKLKSGETIPYQSDPGDVLEVLRFTNVETIPLVSNLSDDKVLHRVFGAGIQNQLIMIVNQSLPYSQIQKMKNTLEEAARFNKEQQLKYQRIIFAIAPIGYAHHLMADIIEDLQNSKFKVLLTRTNYNAFALQRFLYSEEQLTVDNLIKFIEDARNKKLTPYYRSQPKPLVQQGDIIKIVGKTFSEEIYANNNNIMVLFYDSKDPHSYQSWKNVVQNFVDKYKSYYGDKLSVGMLDLALNQHQNLYLKYAPQLHLFSKKSKKQPHRFEGNLNEQTLKQFVVQSVKQITIPDNVGNPLPLSGSEL